MNQIWNLFDGFNEFTQLVFGFALGLAFSQANITVGWIVFWIIAWEFGVYVLFSHNPYYNPFFRIAYNCMFLLAILIGQYIYFGKTTFQNLLYSNYPETKSKFSGDKYQVMMDFEKILDNWVDDEDKRRRRKIRRKRALYYK